MAAPSQRGHRGDSRSGASAGANLEVVGLREFRRDLRKLADGRALTLKLSRASREIAKQAAKWSQGEAKSMGGPYAHFARMIKGAGGVTGARVQIDTTANATFWGAKKRTGWNARNPRSRQQHPDWVGNSWDVGVAGQGPYAINAAIAEHADEIADAYMDEIHRIAREAFPDNP